MSLLLVIVAVLTAITTLVIAALTLRPTVTTASGGRVLAFVAFFGLPVLVTGLAATAHLEHSKSTEFCLSCHVMEPYGRSLLIDDPEAQPAHHFQNRRMSRDQACFTCHTTYTLYGDLQAKLQGLKHVYVYYLGELPEKIELYQPYNNRECLSCHGGARSFEENDMHVDISADLVSGEISCLECHDIIHEVDHLDDLALWQEGEP